MSKSSIDIYTVYLLYSKKISVKGNKPSTETMKPQILIWVLCSNWSLLFLDVTVYFVVDIKVVGKYMYSLCVIIESLNESINIDNFQFDNG